MSTLTKFCRRGGGGAMTIPLLLLVMIDLMIRSASAGNRTRVTSMATMYSTTRPLMLVSNNKRRLTMHVLQHWTPTRPNPITPPSIGHAHKHTHRITPEAQPPHRDRTCLYGSVLFVQWAARCWVARNQNCKHQHLLLTSNCA